MKAKEKKEMSTNREGDRDDGGRKDYGGSE